MFILYVFGEEYTIQRCFPPYIFFHALHTPKYPTRIGWLGTKTCIFIEVLRVNGDRRPGHQSKTTFFYYFFLSFFNFFTFNTPADTEAAGNAEAPVQPMPRRHSVQISGPCALENMLLNKS